MDHHRAGAIFREYLHSDNVEELVNILQAEPRHLQTQLAAISPAQSIKQALDEVPQDQLGHKGALAAWKEVHRRYPNLSVSLKRVAAYVQDCWVTAVLTTGKQCKAKRSVRRTETA